MHPFGLDPIEPRALDGHGTHHHTTAAFTLDPPLVGFEPLTHRLADVPRRMVPHHPQCRVSFCSPSCRSPRTQLRGHRTDRTTVHKAEEHVLCVSTSQPIACDGLG